MTLQRIAGLENRMSAVEAEVAGLKATQIANHAANRESIHTLNNSQQVIIEQNRVFGDNITELNTKMDMVIGSDHGKPGKLDTLSTELKAGLREIKDAAEATAAEVREKLEAQGTTQASQNWLYEFAKAAILGVVLALITYWIHR